MKRSNLKPHTIIFSVSKAHRIASDNRVRSEAVRGLLTSFGIPYKAVEGKYDDEVERSFVVHGKHEELVRILASESRQDSYLYLDEYRNAYLVGVSSGIRKPIGKYIHTSRKPEGDYTRDGEHYYEVV
jgi:hypothetical protein